ncbi:MAG: GSCFA domain-containing protein [Prevotella sp.]|nr:GSCFA domain-containing protein [Prevotella sp.]
MEFRTPVQIARASFSIPPCARFLFVGSCFADNMGRRFLEEKFRAETNPFGVMYNPASILHTIERLDEPFPYVVITLGTNHVYRLKETGEIVDNCQKRPQKLFNEEELSVSECRNYLVKTIELLVERCPSVHVILTVSPIRYAKYGFHGSQLSKATLLLAANEVAKEFADYVVYFPAYEILNDELRDYRFYAADMIHPSEKAVEFIWQRFGETFFGEDTWQFMEEWRPIKEALGHRPFNSASKEYQEFLAKTHEKVRLLAEKYPGFAI